MMEDILLLQTTIVLVINLEVIKVEKEKNRQQEWENEWEREIQRQKKNTESKIRDKKI